MVPFTEEQRETFLRFQFDAQDQHYRKQYPNASYQVILKDTEPIGRFYVSRDSDQIRILDITVLPDYRSAGFGSTLIRELLAEADENNQRVNVWVEQFNPSQALFRRLGFTVIGDDGYNNLMEYCPRT